MHDEEYALRKVFEALFDQVKEVETVKFQRNFTEKLISKFQRNHRFISLNLFRTIFPPDPKIFYHFEYFHLFLSFFLSILLLLSSSLEAIN